MSPAFVSQAVFSSTFTGSNVSTSSTCSNKPIISMSGSDGEAVNKNVVSRRRALINGALMLASGTLLSSSAMAKSGDSPVISVFGVGGASSPFTAGVQTGGKKLYAQFSDDELDVFKRIVDESKDRIVGAVDSIKAKSWEDIRSRCRLEAYELRKVTLKINDSITDKSVADKAKKIAKNIKEDLEQLDLACVAKNQDSAYKKYNAVVKDIGEWIDVVGL